jgi:hypothetical protein
MPQELLAPAPPRTGGRTLPESVEHIDASVIPRHIEDTRLDPQRTAGATVMMLIGDVKGRAKLEAEAVKYVAGFKPATRPEPAVEVLQLVMEVKRFREGIELRRWRAAVVSRVRRERDETKAQLERLEAEWKSGRVVFTGSDPQAQYLKRREQLSTVLKALEARVARLDPDGSDKRRAAAVEKLLGDPGALVESLASHVPTPPKLRDELQRAMESPRLRLDRDTQLYKMAAALVATLEKKDQAAREKVATQLVETALSGSLAGILELAQSIGENGGRSPALEAIAGSEPEFLAMIRDIFENGV